MDRARRAVQLWRASDDPRPGDLQLPGHLANPLPSLRTVGATASGHAAMTTFLTRDLIVRRLSLLPFICLLLLAQVPARAEPAAAGPLHDYVTRPDDSYGWTV